MPARLCRRPLNTGKLYVVSGAHMTPPCPVSFSRAWKVHLGEIDPRKNTGFQTSPPVVPSCPIYGSPRAFRIVFMKWKKYRDTRKIRFKGVIDRPTKEQRFLAQIQTSGFLLPRNWWNIAARRKQLVHGRNWKKRLGTVLTSFRGSRSCHNERSLLHYKPYYINQ